MNQENVHTISSHLSIYRNLTFAESLVAYPPLLRARVRAPGVLIRLPLAHHRPGGRAHDRLAIQLAALARDGVAYLDRLPGADGQALALDQVAVGQAEQRISRVGSMVGTGQVAGHVYVRVLERRAAAQPVLQVAVDTRTRRLVMHGK